MEDSEREEYERQIETLKDKLEAEREANEQEVYNLKEQLEEYPSGEDRGRPSRAVCGQ